MARGLLLSRAVNQSTRVQSRGWRNGKLHDRFNGNGYSATKCPHVTGDRSRLINGLLHCSTSKPPLNVALTSPCGHRKFLRLVWVTSDTPTKPGYAHSK